MTDRTAQTVALLTVLMALPAWAMQLQMTRPELCGISHRVVIGEVTSGETLWAEGEYGGVFRRVWFATERTLRGDEADTIEVILPGGTIGDFVHTVEDVPDLQIDGRYLLFLQQSPAGAWFVVGGEQGAVRVQPPAGGDGERFIDALASVGDCRAQ